MSCREDDLCQARIAFHGHIIADATHEIQNHFAVIKEYNGLIGDLLQSRQNDMENCVKRCLEISSNINDRARLAADMVDILNRFTHRGDSAISRFQVEEVVEELVSLMQRSASRKKIRLEASHGRKLPEVSNDASLLQYTLYSLIQPIIETLPENGRLKVSADRGKGKIPQVTLTAEGITALVDQDLLASEQMKMSLSRLEGSFSIEDNGRKRQGIILSIPSLS